MNGIQKVSGSIPLISTTYLIHHICPMWFFLFIPLTAISDSLDSMRHFVPLKSVPYLTGSIPLISTTYLIHHICPMWFFLFIPLTAIRLTRFHASLCSFEIGSLLNRFDLNHLYHNKKGHIIAIWPFCFIKFTHPDKIRIRSGRRA